MSKLKKMLAVISTVGLLSVSTGSIASSNLGQKSSDSTPAFLQNTGAVMMSDSDMNNVRGEIYGYADYIALKTFVSSLKTTAKISFVGMSYAMISDITSNNGRGLVYWVGTYFDYLNDSQSDGIIYKMTQYGYFK